MSREEKRRRWGTRRGRVLGGSRSVGDPRREEEETADAGKDEAIDGDHKREEEGEGDAE